MIHYTKQKNWASIWSAEGKSQVKVVSHECLRIFYVVIRDSRLQCGNPCTPFCWWLTSQKWASSVVRIAPLAAQQGYTSALLDSNFLPAEATNSGLTTRFAASSWVPLRPVLAVRAVAPGAAGRIKVSWKHVCFQDSALHLKTLPSWSTTRLNMGSTQIPDYWNQFPQMRVLMTVIQIFWAKACDLLAGLTIALRWKHARPCIIVIKNWWKSDAHTHTRVL